VHKCAESKLRCKVLRIVACGVVIRGSFEAHEDVPRKLVKENI
jgi:hypothetical protein